MWYRVLLFIQGFVSMLSKVYGINGKPKDLDERIRKVRYCKHSHSIVVKRVCKFFVSLFLRANCIFF